MSYPFRTILSPVDFNENSLAALDVAKQIALDLDSTIHLIHVVPSVLAPDEANDAWSTEEEEVRRRLHQIAQDRLDGVPHVIHASAGETAKEVAHTAEVVGADLIVVATHGRSGLEHFFLGSVAEKVVRESPCPVLTIRPVGKGKAVPGR